LMKAKPMRLPSRCGFSRFFETGFN
jgi:hypothetical protein